MDPQQQNQYAFITEPTKVPKKSLFPSGGSSKERMLIVAGISLVVLLIGFGVYAVLGSVGSAQKQEWLKAAQQHEELIRISELGSKKAQNRETKNLAITTTLSLTSSQTSINSIAKTNGVKVDNKSLASGKNAETDAELKTAEQTNQFDKVFADILKKELTDYQKRLKKLYDEAGNKKTKDNLSGIYNNAEILATEANR